MSFVRRLYAVLLVLLVPWSVATSPLGPLTDLGNAVWYVTLVSHVALFLALLTALHGARIEDDDE